MLGPSDTGLGCSCCSASSCRAGSLNRAAPKPPALVVLVCTDRQLTCLQEQTPQGIVLTVRTGTDGKVAAAEAPGLLPESSGRGVQPLDAFVAKLTQIVAADYSIAAMQTPLDLCESTSSFWLHLLPADRACASCRHCLATLYQCHAM